MSYGVYVRVRGRGVYAITSEEVENTIKGKSWRRMEGIEEGCALALALAPATNIKRRFIISYDAMAWGRG